MFTIHHISLHVEWHSHQFKCPIISKCKPVWNPIAIIHEFEFTRSCKYIWPCCAYWTHVRQNGNIWQTLKSQISSLYNIFRVCVIINFQHFALYTALSRLVPLFKSSVILFEKENEKTLAFCQIVVEKNQYCQQHQQFPLILLSEPTWLYEIRWSPHAIYTSYLDFSTLNVR